MAKPRRVVRRRPAKPISRGDGIINALKPANIIEALKPSNMKAYWTSHAGRQMALKIGGSIFLLLFLIFLFVAKDLPSPGKINSLIGAQTTRFYDRTEQTVLYEVHGDINRTVINFDQMPGNVKQATISVEDKDFYKHGAFSVFGILRAAFVDLFHRGSGLQGGSTITQQYVKKALLTDKQTFTRKVKELILSMEIEAFYSKDDILKLYLNEIPYGTQAYGIQAAAKTYFGKDAKDLSLPESALLAAIPRAPSYYTPYGDHTDDLIARQHLILDDMAQQGYITQAQADDAKKVDILAEIPKIPRTYANVTAPFFVKYVEAQLDDKYTPQVVDSGGLKVITSLDLTKQKEAEDAVAKNMKNVRSLGGSNAALVAADPKTGQVEAWVGGSDFSESQVDVANADRQPGSSFKPFVYSTLFSKKDGTTYGPGTTIYDVATDFGGGYKPHNYCLCNYGAISIRTAIGSSLNIPAVKALYMAGVEPSIKTAHDMGITTLNNDPGSYGLSLVLGSGEVKLADMVNGYSGFATGGNHFDPVAVLKITDAKGKVLEDNTKPATPKRVVDPQVAYELNSIMSDATARTLTFGPNFSPLIIPGKTTAVKTGTTENFRDAWTIGYTQSLVAGVWTGNNDGRSMSGSSGAVAAPIWHDFMVAATKDAPNEPFVRPSGIKDVTLDAETGRLANDKSKNKRTDIFADWYKATLPSDAKSAKIDKLSGKLATDCTPPLAIDTVFANDIHAEIPSSDPAYGRWEPPVEALAAKLGYQNGGTLPTDSDNVHHCDDVKPTVNVSATVNGPTIHIVASYTSGTFSANKLDISFDDQVISTQSPIASNPYSFDYTATSIGGHTIKAVVTDGGLYTADNSTNITVTDLNSSFKGVTPANGGTHNGALVTYAWTNFSGGSGPTTYQLYVDGAAVGGATGSTAKNNVPTTFGGHSWYVQAIQGGSGVATTTPNGYTNAP